MAFRCSQCSINYPKAGNCQVCDGSLSIMAGSKPDEDWEDKVRLAKGVPVDPLDELAKVQNWRTMELYAAGYPHSYAVRLAKDSSIDLHQAVTILKGCGDLNLALDILL